MLRIAEMIKSTEMSLKKHHIFAYFYLTLLMDSSGRLSIYHTLVHVTFHIIFLSHFRILYLLQESFAN